MTDIESAQAHKHAVELNRQAFDEVLARKYDKKETQILMAYLFAKHILEFDLGVPVKRRSLEESEPLLGDAHLPFSGFSREETLPDPGTYLEKYPKTIFRPGMKLLNFACGTGWLLNYSCLT